MSVPPVSLTHRLVNAYATRWWNGARSLGGQDWMAVGQHARAEPASVAKPIGAEAPHSKTQRGNE